LKIQKTGEELRMPVMISTKVQDLRGILAQMFSLSSSAAHSIEFLAKVGMSMRRLRNSDEIRTNVVVRNLESFTKPKQRYPHPYCVIGAGHHGLRQAMHYARHEVDFVLVDRKSRLGGHAWATLANHTSCTQSEGVHYQLTYDPVESTAALKPDYGCWPSTAKILKHFEDTCDEYGVTPHMKLNTDAFEMTVEDNADFVQTRYNLFWCSSKEGCHDSGKLTVSNICFYPGAMVSPREAHWPGEDDYEGQLQYAHGNLFDFKALTDQDVIIIGCGAFANENIRTSIEFGARKIYLVVRNLNIFLPRCVCWFVNQSINAPPGAIVFAMMQPIYKLIGWDVFEMPTVIVNKDKSSVLLRQNARWGTGDIFFLGVYFEKVEVIKAEVKRFKSRGAVLTDGTVLNNVSNVMKCLGFVGDMKVDKLMQTKQHVGIFPNGDWRRTVYAEFLAIDAGRFGGTAFGPGGASITYYTLWYHQHPADAARLLSNNVLATNKAKPDLGKPAYDFPPRAGSMNMMQMGANVPEISDFETTLNTPFKKASVWHLQYPEKHIKECTEDWNKYSRMLIDQGCTKPWPPYPYTPQDLHDYAQKDSDLSGAPARSESPGAGMGVTNPNVIKYGSPECFAPIRDVLVKRSRSPASKPSAAQVDGWFREALRSVQLTGREQSPAPLPGD